MLTLSFFIFCVMFAFILFGITRIKGCDSGVQMLNADWLDAEDKFKLVSRWGMR